MNITITEKKDKSIRFIFEGHYTYANALRRFCMTHVPIMAIDTVEILKNDSAMYDEILAHRLGLIPLKMDPKLYGQKTKEISMVLKAMGPGYVYSEQIESRDPVVAPVYGKMPITYLGQGKEIELSCKAMMGTGKEHAKFIPCHITYKSYPKIDILGQPKNPMEFMRLCPKDVFTFKNDTLRIKDVEKCDMCKLCEEKHPETVKIGRVKDKFIFEMESWGQLEPQQLLEKAKNLIIEETREMGKAIKTAKKKSSKKKTKKKEDSKYAKTCNYCGKVVNAGEGTYYYKKLYHQKCVEKKKSGSK